MGSDQRRGLSEHGIRIQGTTEKAHSALIYAEGGWRKDAWRGALREMVIGAPVDLRLLLPADLVIGSTGATFGPAHPAAASSRTLRCSRRCCGSR